MPTYQYACTDSGCGHNFEAVQAFSDAALTECPECGGKLRKVFSAVGVVFKGSGFYRTDSRTSSGKTSSGKSAESSTDGAAKKSGESKDSGDSGRKTEAKSASSNSNSTTPAAAGAAKSAS